MKKALLALCLCLGFALSSQAQVKTEINPAVQWKFVRSNEIRLESGQLQTFEFPAYKNLDYLVNLEIQGEKVDVELFIYDMQSELIGELQASNAQSAQLPFNVLANATYQVAVRFKNKEGKEIKQVECLMSLLKRPKI